VERPTHCPAATSIDAKYEYEVRRPPPWSTVTDDMPATDPAKVTWPVQAGNTGVPSGASRSIPQWPPKRPTGPKARTIAPGTGGSSFTHGTAGWMAPIVSATSSGMAPNTIVSTSEPPAARSAYRDDAAKGTGSGKTEERGRVEPPPGR